LTKACRTAVKMVLPFIGGQMIGLSIDGKCGAGSPAGTAANDTAEVIGVGEIFADGVKSCYDVPADALFVGCDNRKDDTSIVRDFDDDAVVVGKLVRYCLALLLLVQCHVVYFAADQ